MSHHCHATGCETSVSPEMFMCKKHWYLLPKSLRDAVWTTYRPGQCDDWRISQEYANAAKNAVGFVATLEGRIPDTSIYDVLEPKSPKRRLALAIGGKLGGGSPYQRHKAEWKDCRRCPLHLSRRNVVLVRGRLPCDVLMVGEAPGVSEDALGKPFVGPAGKLLDRIVEDAGGGVSRVRLAFTNVIACIPYDDGGQKVSEPPDIAVKRCHPRLVDLICMAKPDKIVCVGSVSAKQFGKTDIEFTQILHPAAILRAPAASQGLMYQKTVVQLAEVFESLIPF